MAVEPGLLLSLTVKTRSLALSISIMVVAGNLDTFHCKNWKVSMRSCLESGLRDYRE